MSAQGSSGTPSNTSGSENLTGTGRSRSRSMGMGAAIGIAIVLLLVGIAGGYFLYPQVNKSGAGGSTVQLTETGSSLLYPLMKIWGPNYTAYNPSVAISPFSSGSGTGQSSAELGLYNIGASDGYLSNASATSLINVPVAISAQLIYYNLPGVTGHLDLNGTMLAMIYEGNITTWTNPLILNAQTSTIKSQLTSLPAATQTITVVKRGDSSGDTFLFTSLCYMSWKGWTYKYSTSALTGLTGAHVVSATGNSQMVTSVDGQAGAIAYIGISYESSVAAAGVNGVNYAALGDNSSLSAAGGTDPANYVLPTAASISADANLGLTHLQFSQYGLAVSLILGGSPAGAINLTAGAGGTAPPAGQAPYPIANLEYALIKTSPTGNVVTSAALHATVEFIEWAISKGNYGPGYTTSTYLSEVSFVPLTAEVQGLVVQELSQVNA